MVSSEGHSSFELVMSFATLWTWLRPKVLVALFLTSE